MLRAEQKSFLHQKNMILKKFKAKKLQPNNMTKWSQPTKKLKKLDICLNGKFGILYHATFLRIGKFSSINNDPVKSSDGMRLQFEKDPIFLNLR